MKQNSFISFVSHMEPGHGSVYQTQCLTRFSVLTCSFIAALFLYRVTPSR